VNVRQTITRLRAAVDPLPVTSGDATIDARLGELSDEDLDRLGIVLTQIRGLYPQAMRPVLAAVAAGRVPPWADHGRAFAELAVLWAEVSQIWSPGGPAIDWGPSEIGESLSHAGITPADLARYEDALTRMASQ
jgi:hypothetical protein